MTDDTETASTAHSNRLATDLVRNTIEDLHHAIDVPAARAGGAPARVDTAKLSASLVDRANGATDAADAQP